MRNHTNYCVYCNINKVNGKRYVGITCRIPEQRWQGGAGYSRNKHFHAAIKKYGLDSFDHIIMHYWLTHQDACEYEKQYIKQKTYGDISKCFHGKRKTVGGYVWGYVND